ncbi:MAG TPA: ATP-binding protein, partial [Gaiellaceae bacterium]|nr:ATP-binding protein [Gaiellaceae bacterium]
MAVALPSIVGRESEVSELASQLTPERLPCVLLVEGEAGTGKTSLCAHVFDEARERGFTTLATRPVAAEADLALAGLGDLLQPVLGAVLEQLPPPQAQALRVALLLEQGDEAADARMLGVAFLSALRALSDAQPVALFVDDVHWLDASSAAVLAFAARRLERERVALLCTRRTGHEDRVLGDLTRVRALALRGLSPGALTDCCTTGSGSRCPAPACAGCTSSRSETRFTPSSSRPHTSAARSRWNRATGCRRRSTRSSGGGSRASPSASGRPSPPRPRSPGRPPRAWRARRSSRRRSRRAWSRSATARSSS